MLVTLWWGATLRVLETYPDVQLRAFILLPLEHLGRGVGRTAAPRGQRLARVVEVPESKVYPEEGRLLSNNLELRVFPSYSAIPVGLWWNSGVSDKSWFRWAKGLEGNRYNQANNTVT